MIVRDAGCILVGLGGIAYQTLVPDPGDADPAVLTTCVAILSAPVLVAARSLRNGGSGTTTSSSPPQESEQQSSPSSSP